MATYTKTVDPNGGANYASLSAWEAGEQTLYVSGDIAIADCKRTGATKDTAAFAIAGWTAGVVPKIIVNAAHRHEGKWADQRGDGNYIYTVTSGSADNVRLGVVNAEVDGLLIAPTTNRAGIINAGGVTASDNFYIRNCIINGGGASTGYGINNGNAGIVNVYNCIAFNFDGASNGYGFGCVNASATVNTYNCTAYKNRYGFARTAGTLTCTNTGSFSNTTGAYTGASASSNYNVSSDATATGTTKATGKTAYADYFVDHTNGDFHLKASSLTLWGVSGADLSGTFTTDIDGQTRSGTWDIGADQYVAAGGGTTTIFSDLAMLWDMSGQVSSDLSVVWDIFNSITSDASVKWDILNSISSDLSLRFGILNQAFSGLGVKWDMFAETNGDLSIVFDIRNLTQSDLSLIWDAAGTVFSDLTLKFDLGDVSGRIKIIGSSFRRFI